MVLKDYRGLEIQLSDEALEHIKKGHAEMTVEAIKQALQEPDEVRKSKHIKPSSKCHAELYYRRKEETEPGQWGVVVVKLCPDGNFVTTAYSSSILKGEIVYQKSEKSKG
jgi:hypothetical protein